MSNQQIQSTSLLNNNVFKALSAFTFILLVIYLVSMFILPDSGDTIIVVAAAFGAYMALNIGANDVANNVGPAVGSKALTLFAAITIAVIFEAAGALLAGGDVVNTIKKDIIDPALIADSKTFIWIMMAALLAAAIWLNIATALNAPVSTTHSIVGGVLGAGVAAGGMGIANWSVFGKIAASWVISPLFGGIIAASFLYLIKRTITYKADKIVAAKRIVPLLISLMAWVFSTYLLLKGLKKIWEVDIFVAGGIGFAIAVIVFFIISPIIKKSAIQLKNSKSGVNRLFTIPLICSAALLCFAHGANDVANAVAPLAAINDAVLNAGIAAKASIPLWVMLVGAIGISTGLALYGPKLIRTVGSEITGLTKIRAFCVAMAAAITVIIASQLGLPVSSTHTAVGAIFGVGFLREYLKHSNAKRIAEIREHHKSHAPDEVDKVLKEFEQASIKEKAQILFNLKKTNILFTKKERSSLKKVYKKELVKRSHLYKIATAWIITVPLSALLAAFLYFTIRGFMLP
ncbi:MAG: inorganic phosphate transporter [Methylococcales symbiont of Iophon sp. n. MRB-2018]|nr:MAG: inorganic phosphate transporter [Methylococcales symbiont of Iophon sp. n. MRB-2018]KAF3980184.1 MAG: inorganic phosphate transporter [Methylococcales symbiont of Iophon sp. n. MRB-2018]